MMMMMMMSYTSFFVFIPAGIFSRMLMLWTERAMFWLNPVSSWVRLNVNLNSMNRASNTWAVLFRSFVFSFVTFDSTGFLRNCYWELFRNRPLNRHSASHVLLLHADFGSFLSVMYCFCGGWSTYWSGRLSFLISIPCTTSWMHSGSLWLYF